MLNTKPRPCLDAVTPYLPGKPIGEVQRELGIRDVIKLASNENPLGVSPRARAALLRWSDSCHLYPEGSSPLLRHELSVHLGVHADRILVGNGSDEIIRLLCEAFLESGDEVVVSRYGFIRFRQAAGLMGARVIEVPMRGWTHDLEAMAGAVTRRTKLVFVASPNNPTGTYNNVTEIRRFMGSVPKTALVVLDEAYYHYATPKKDYPQSIPGLVDRHENMVVLRTFSKVYGLAGLRVGYGVGDIDLMRWLNRIRMPFNVNLPAQHAAAAALGDMAFVRKSVRLAEAERLFLMRNLCGLGLAPVASASNFIFVDVRRDANVLYERLLREGVIVRPMGEYGLHRHLRISLGTRPQNRRLLEALRHALNSGKHG